MQIPAGYLLDKFNARFVVSGGLLLLAVGNIAISFSHNLVLFASSNFLQGVGASFAFIAAAVLISQWFPAKLFPILFGLTQTLSCILAGVIHYYFMVILKTHTWNEIYRGLAAFGFVLLIFSLIFVKTPAGYKREINLSLKNSLASVLKNKQIILCCIAAATSFGVLLAYASFWYVQIQTFYSVEDLDAVVISGVIFTGIGVGTPLLGWFSNIVKSRLMVLHITLVIGIMTLLLGIYLPHYAINTLISIKLVSFLIGFFLSGSMLFYTIANEIVSKSVRGVAISVLNTSVFLFNTLMLFIPQLFITNIAKDFFTYFWAMLFFVLLSILLLFFIKESYSST